MNTLTNTVQTYLNKFSDTTKLIKTPVNSACKQIIVIPSYCEPELEKTLQSLCQCKQTEFFLEVMVVLNCSANDEKAKKYHEGQLNYFSEKFVSCKKISFHFISVNSFPEKHAGVGLARKTGMDEACRRFAEIDFDGLIVCLDADCSVSENYLRELEKIAIVPGNYNSVCLHFEHDVEQEKNEELKTGIIFYELYLRYYKESLAYCNFPYAFHTIGSSMAVKASVYCRAGGMNKRKAAEDFYFLHKVFPYGKVIELNSITVYPSCRISTRVPFGTGRAQQNFVEARNKNYATYNFKIFEDLRTFVNFNFYRDNFVNVKERLPASVQKFLTENNFSEKVVEIRNNTSSEEQFNKRFFIWLDGFMVLKFVHYARDNFYRNEGIEEAIVKLFPAMNAGRAADAAAMLKDFRVRQRK